MRFEMVQFDFIIMEFIHQYQIWLYVAISIAFEVTRQGMVTVFFW